MATINLTSEDFEKSVLKDGIVFVDFWAAWCGPCRMFAPIFEGASEKYPEMTFAKVDTDAERELAGAAGITSIPTLMAFRDGVLVFRQAGALPAPNHKAAPTWGGLLASPSRAAPQCYRYPMPPSPREHDIPLDTPLVRSVETVPAVEDRAYILFIAGAMASAILGGFTLSVILSLAMSGTTGGITRVQWLIQAHG